MSRIHSYLSLYPLQIIVLAVMYILGGKLAIAMAVPPHYTVAIWPAAGIALGALIAYGNRLWPGILIGGFLLHCCLSGAFSLAEGLDIPKAQAAIGAAIAATIQAVFGSLLATRAYGRPLRLSQFSHIAGVFALSAVIPAFAGASITTYTAYIALSLPSETAMQQWAIIWISQLAGIIIFLPLALIAPGRAYSVIWKNKPLGTLPVLIMLIILMPLGLSVYTWRLSSVSAHEQANMQFEALAMESKRVMLNRLQSYDNALLGGAGFFQGTDNISRREWSNYVETIRVGQNFPGLNGIGWIKPVRPEEKANFTEAIRKDNAPNFSIHPDTTDKPYYVITYIEPEEINRQAIGLNIGFEENRREAANLSRDTGKPAITKRITLVQDAQKKAGFLLLHPIYYHNMPSNTMRERQNALRGWIYAPFIADNLLENLTSSQEQLLHLQIYDGNTADPDHLIFDSNLSSAKTSSAYTVHQTLNVMQQQWHVVWQSTSAFEQQARNSNALLILLGGVLFTGMLMIFLIVIVVNHPETMEWIAGERKFAFPTAVFLLACIGAIFLYNNLREKELHYARRMVEEETSKIELVLTRLTAEKMRAMRRMAQRWEIQNGTPYDLWKKDADNYISDLAGLKAVEWIDEEFRIRWAAPLQGNEKIMGMRSSFDERNSQRNSNGSYTPTITPPFNLAQGYKGFIIYIPLYLKNVFDGLIAGVFSCDDFFGNVIISERINNYYVTISYEGQVYYSNTDKPFSNTSQWTSTRFLPIHDKQWKLQITPKEEYIRNQLTALPLIVLVALLLIAALSALAMRYILISRIKSLHLKASEQTFRAAMEDASIGMALVHPDGRWLKVNQSLCDLLGYSEDELLSIDFQSITHPDDVDEDVDLVQQMLRNEIKTYQMEKRYYHRKGKIIWALLSVSLVRYANGKPRYFISQIQDITEQREMERLKSEFISIVSHELRTPLTSIRGSLGLVIGAFSGDLTTKVKDLLNIANNNCERLILLINDILDIDKIASGQMRFNMQEESLANITTQAVETNQAYAEKYNTSIVLHPVDEALYITVDANRYIQVLSNLLSNAAKFSPEGSTIDVNISLRDNMARIAVTDYGSGVPAEFHTRIFEKFSQADSSSSRSKGGTGLGLHITKQFVEQMHGRIGFKSEPDKATTFWIEFPFAVRQASQPLPEIEENQRILICEDVPDIAKVLHLMLKHANYESDVAHTLEEARQMLAETHYTALTLDISLPDGSGLAFADELLQNSITHDIPVVMLSGNERSVVDEGQEDRPNVVRWLTKPVFQRDLLDAIHAAFAATSERKGKR